MFHDPPGTPIELKCVNCKLAAGGVLLGLTGLGGIGVKRMASKNVYAMMSFIGLTAFSFTGASLSFRLAYEHNIYNKKLTAEKAKEISAKRKENRLKLEQQQAA